MKDNELIFNDMGKATIKNGKGEIISFDEMVREASQMDHLCAKEIIFHGKEHFTLGILKEIESELGTLNYKKVEKILVGKRMFNRNNIIKDWVNERVMKALEKIDLTGELSDIKIDMDTFARQCRFYLAAEITDVIIDTMHAVQRHGLK